MTLVLALSMAGMFTAGYLTRCFLGWLIGWDR